MRFSTSLQDIHPDRIRANPENPRLVFREQDMSDLLESIRKVGIQVPITVYQDGGAYYLLDGERRWRCARKLNMQQMPAIVQPKPEPLENILMMFNIHNVRVAWDLMPLAVKLGQVREMLGKAGKPNGAADLAGVTGVRRPTVQRALELLELPQKYRDELLREAEKPRDLQEVTADLFVEINKSRSTLRRYAPDVLKSVGEDNYVDAMVEKYRQRRVASVTQYRDVSRIARGEVAGVDEATTRGILVKLVEDRDYSIKDAYEDSVRAAYEQRDLTSRLSGLAVRLKEVKTGEGLTPQLVDALQGLRREIDRVLRGDR